MPLPANESDICQPGSLDPAASDSSAEAGAPPGGESESAAFRLLDRPRIAEMTVAVR